MSRSVTSYQVTEQIFFSFITGIKKEHSGSGTKMSTHCVIFLWWCCDPLCTVGLYNGLSSVVLIICCFSNCHFSRVYFNHPFMAWSRAQFIGWWYSVVWIALCPQTLTSHSKQVGEREGADGAFLKLNCFILFYFIFIRCTHFCTWVCRYTSIGFIGTEVADGWQLPCADGTHPGSSATATHALSLWDISPVTIGMFTSGNHTADPQPAGWAPERS